MTNTTPTCLIEAQYAPASTGSLYTSPTSPSTNTIIDKFTVTNISGGSVNLSVYLVPFGESAGNSNLIIDVLAVASDAVIDITELQNQILAPGDFISVLGSSASSLVVRASGRAVT